MFVLYCTHCGQSRSNRESSSVKNPRMRPKVQHSTWYMYPARRGAVRPTQVSWRGRNQRVGTLHSARREPGAAAPPDFRIFSNDWHPPDEASVCAFSTVSSGRSALVAVAVELESAGPFLCRELCLSYSRDNHLGIVLTNFRPIVAQIHSLAVGGRNGAICPVVPGWRAKHPVSLVGRARPELAARDRAGHDLTGDATAVLSRRIFTVH